jgi:hypothetical protein
VATSDELVSAICDLVAAGPVAIPVTFANHGVEEVAAIIPLYPRGRLKAPPRLNSGANARSAAAIDSLPMDLQRRRQAYLAEREAELAKGLPF